MSESINVAVALPGVRRPDSAGVLQSLAWRYVRHGGWSLLLSLLVVCGVPTLMFGLLRLADPVILNNLGEDAVSLQRLFFMMEIGTFLTILLFATVPHLRPLYTLPLATRQIIHTQLGIATVSVVVLHLATVVYYQVMFHASIPVVGPLLFLLPGLFIATGLAALFVDFSWWRPIVGLTAVFFLAWSGGMRFTDPDIMSQPGAWMTPTLLEFLLLAALAVAGYVITMHTAHRDRRGDTQSWQILEEWLHRVLARITDWLPTRQADNRLGSPTSAQFAFQWLTRGVILPVVVAGFGMLSLMVAYYDPREWLRGYIVSLPFLVAFAMVFNGYIVGITDTVQGNLGQMNRYRATRPLSDGQLAAATIKSGLAGTLAALLISLLLFAIVYAYAQMSGLTNEGIWANLYARGEPPFGPGVLNYIGMFLVMAMLGWAAFGFNLTSVICGRQWIVVAIWGIGMATVMLNVVLEKALSAGQMQTVQSVIGMGLGLLAIAATLLAFGWSKSLGLISMSHVVAGGGLCLLAVATLGVAASGHAAWSPTTVTFGFGMAALVAMPLASTPLAVYWNRHR